MSCYLTKMPEASARDYHFWKNLGYTGTFEQYKEIKSRNSQQGNMFICGELGEHCADCMDIATILCDYPVGEGKTCDRAICDDHAHRINLDTHYCIDHHAEWEKFKANGGVEKILKNIVPFN